MRKAIKIKINIPEERIQDVKDLMNTASEIFNIHTEYAFNNKTYSKQKAHHELYGSVREKYAAVPSGLIQSIRDNALESMKAIECKISIKKSGYSTLRFDKRTSTLRGRQLTLSCIGNRIKIILNIPKYFRSIFYNWKYLCCMLSFRDECFWISLVFDGEAEKTNDVGVIGIDRGIYNIATTSDGEQFSGKAVRSTRRKHLYTRKTLQKKGTRSAKLRLVSMKGKEKRFIRDVNHCISKSIVKKPANIYVLEDLKGMREQRKGKKLNKWLSNWSFFQLETFLTYKAGFKGKRIEYVDARYTSQKCSVCGVIEKKNRKKSVYLCKCGNKLHSDINAAINIRNNYLQSM